MEGTTVEHRVSAEGADYLLLAGVNDNNLQELARLSGSRVILRGDHLILSGEVIARNDNSISFAGKGGVRMVW